MKIKLFTSIILIIISLHLSGQNESYSIDFSESSISVIETDGPATNILAQIQADQANVSGEMTLTGNFAKISLNNLQIAHLGGNELGLDGDIVPYSSVTFDLGNAVADEHWDRVVATTFVTYSGSALKSAKFKSLGNYLDRLALLEPVVFEKSNHGNPVLGFQIPLLKKSASRSYRI